MMSLSSVLPPQFTLAYIDSKKKTMLNQFTPTPEYIANIENLCAPQQKIHLRKKMTLRKLESLKFYGLVSKSEKSHDLQNEENKYR